MLSLCLFLFGLCDFVIVMLFVPVFCFRRCCSLVIVLFVGLRLLCALCASVRSAVLILAIVGFQFFVSLGAISFILFCFCIVGLRFVFVRLFTCVVFLLRCLYC